MAATTGFTPDFLGSMKSSILALIWPKKDIQSFFSRHGCEKKDVDALASEPNRSAMVDAMFARLEAQADGGLGPLRAMLQSLMNWSHFDPYWFDTTKKLNRAVATRSLDHLRQLQEIRDGRIKQERARRESAEAVAQQARKSVEQVRTEYLALHSGSVKPQERGYALERVLSALARLSKLEVTESFRIEGEQIDGALKYDGEHYLLEAKWTDDAVGGDGVYQFSMKVEGKMYGRGLFVSIKGFSDQVVNSIVSGKALRTVFIDGADLMLVIEERMTLVQIIDKKVKAAQTKGLIYVDPLTGQSKSRA